MPKVLETLTEQYPKTSVRDSCREVLKIQSPILLTPKGQLPTLVIEDKKLLEMYELALLHKMLAKWKQPLMAKQVNKPLVRTSYSKLNLRFTGAKIWNSISDDKKNAKTFFQGSNYSREKK